MSETQTLRPWSTRAINLPDHVDNAIHTDVGARAAGFDRALVAGTTVYAYMTHPVVAAWGPQWLQRGGGELRLRRPVCDDDLVECLIEHDDGGPIVNATVDGEVCASLQLWKDRPAPQLRHGDALTPVAAVLDDTTFDYGARAGDDLALYAEQGTAHPVIWLNLANRVFKQNLVTGPWIHVRSKIFHEGLAQRGAAIRAESVLVERFDSRAGERALVDVRLYADDNPVATIEHEAIIVLAS